MQKRVSRVNERKKNHLEIPHFSPVFKNNHLNKLLSFLLTSTREYKKILKKTTFK
jgi:hypothetical protein